MSSSHWLRPVAAALLLAGAGQAPAQVVISQIYGGGGNTYTHDFIELKNTGAVPVSLNGKSLQYASATGTGTFGSSATQITELPNATIPAGGYFLVQQASGTATVALPTPDHIDPTPIAMSATAGKIALVSDATPLGCNGGSTACSAAQLARIEDLVGYGSANFFEGAAAPAPSNTTALFRAGNGCTDTNNNAADFSTATPAPRNGATPASSCAAGDTAPAVSGTTPADAAIDVLVGSSIGITFSEAVNLDPGWFTLDCPAGTPVAATASGAQPGTTFSITPDSALPLATTCTVTVQAGAVHDDDANDPPDTMAADYSFSFTTETGLPPLPVLSVANVSQPEGDAANTLTFTVQLSAPAGLGGVDFSYATENGTATAGSDYVAASGAGRIDENDSSTTLTIDVLGDTLAEPDETFTLRLTGITGATPTSANATATLVNDDRLHVWQVQGSGACSPLIVPCTVTANTAMVPVAIAASVVTAIGPDGFALQTPDAASDNDPATSDGVYVYTGTTTPPRTDADEDLAVGDLVLVSGGVKEYFGLTEVQVNTTRSATHSIVRLAQGQPMPTPVVFSAGNGPFGTPSSNPAALSCPGSGPGGSNNTDTNFECFEGMLVHIPDGILTTGNQSFGEVAIGPHGQRAYREKGTKFPAAPVAGAAAAGTWDGNPEILELDADRLLAVPLNTELAGGLPFSGVGVIGFEFGDYEFWPAGGEYPAGTPRFVFDPADNVLPRPVRDSAAPSELTVGSFNAWRLCDIIDDIGQPGGGPNNYLIEFDCDATGIEAGGQAAYETKLVKVSAYIIDVLKSPDVLGMQEVEKRAVLEDLAARIEADGGPAYEAYLVEGNDPGGIDVGYLVRSDRIANASVQQLRGQETWNDPSDGLTALHDRPPLLLTGEFIEGIGGRPFKFAVLNAHNRSFGANDRVYAKRFLQARAIAEEVQAYQTNPANAERPLILVGDYNAYQFSDGITDPVGLIAGTFDNAENECAPANAVTTCNLPDDGTGATVQIVDPPLTKHTDVLAVVDPDEVYSYTFTERFGTIWGHTDPTGPDNGREVAANQVIDHLLLSAAVEPLFADFQYGRANVDASEAGHSAGTGPDGQGGIWSQPAIGSSDHDGFVAFFDLDCSSNPAADADGDGVCDFTDNCPVTANADQLDPNGDRIGAACNTAPSITSVAITTGTQSALYSYTVTTTDAEGNAVALSATTLPSWLALTDNGDGTALLAGTPAQADVGSHAVLIEADDQEGSAQQAFSIVVANVNDAPVLANPIPGQSATEGTAFMFQFAADTFTDADGDTLAYSAALSGGAALPAWLSFDPATRTFSGTPALADVGSVDIVVTAEDAEGESATAAFTVTVVALDRADLALSITGATSAACFAEVSQTFVVTNGGPDAATGVVLDGVVPASAADWTVEAAAGTTCSQPDAGGAFSCSVDTLAASASASVTVRGTPWAGACGGSVAFSGTVAGATLDPVDANSASSSVALGSAPDAIFSDGFED